jgi:leucyl/phenylalanyl-tRNA--protein transferase
MPTVKAFSPWGTTTAPFRGIGPKCAASCPSRTFTCRRGLRATSRHHPFEVRWNTAFGDVVRGCADRESTWINETILDTYEELHRLGHAHSAEVWRNGRLVGGVYGVSIGAAFFGESMFSRETQASKVALTCLQHRLHQRGFILHDTQWTTPSPGHVWRPRNPLRQLPEPAAPGHTDCRRPSYRRPAALDARVSLTSNDSRPRKVQSPALIHALPMVHISNASRPSAPAARHRDPASSHPIPLRSQERAAPGSALPFRSCQSVATRWTSSCAT